MVANRRTLLPRVGLITLLAVAGLAFGLVTTGASAGTSIAAGSAAVQAGGQGTSTAVVNRAAADSAFNAYDITLQFNPAVATAASVAPAAGWSLMPAPKIDNAAGTVQVVAVRFDECGTNCPLFNITWNGVAPGATALTLAGSPNERLAGIGEYVSSGFTAGSVTVSAPSTPITPTATATATPVTPTATPPAQGTPNSNAPSIIQIGHATFTVGETGTTNATVNVAPHVPGPDTFELQLTFDPAKAKIANIIPGEGWNFAPQPVIDNTTGSVRLSALRFDYCAAACQLFSIEWEGLTPGSSLVRLVGDADAVLGRDGAYIRGVHNPGSLAITPQANSQDGAPEPKPEKTPKPDKTPKANEKLPVLPHNPGWNLVTWGGESMTPEEALAASNPGSIEVIYVWDAETGKWRRYGANLPGYLNDLKTVKPGDVIWLSASE